MILLKIHGYSRSDFATVYCLQEARVAGCLVGAPCEIFVPVEDAHLSAVRFLGAT